MKKLNKFLEYVESEINWETDETAIKSFHDQVEVENEELKDISDEFFDTIIEPFDDETNEFYERFLLSINQYTTGDLFNDIDKFESVMSALESLFNERYFETLNTQVSFNDIRSFITESVSRWLKENKINETMKVKRFNKITEHSITGDTKEKMIEMIKSEYPRINVEDSFINNFLTVCEEGGYYTSDVSEMLDDLQNFRFVEGLV